MTKFFECFQCCQKNKSYEPAHIIDNFLKILDQHIYENNGFFNQTFNSYSPVTYYIEKKKFENNLFYLIYQTREDSSPIVKIKRTLFLKGQENIRFHPRKDMDLLGIARIESGLGKAKNKKRIEFHTGETFEDNCYIEECAHFGESARKFIQTFYMSSDELQNNLNNSV